ncbi:TPA: AlpA family transcriptional regulator [Salmonella enterica]|uniref:AlpA family transcriptional regulator n=1 Tax=Enterobacter hormaechei TaxID=158836 RepID=A0A6G4LGR6_9ENTR|nr:AlpA family transcriptional regulator [Enterobacter hormaechei]EDW2284004.1 AlpA family transcriptional regulator [Salmonella enterica subsp. enterica]HEA0261800.1 AlpA family transcriptional regulator [Salmonella enterica]MCM7402007.1 AlpA family transcriptional regulator [Enterobacter hormaechei]MCR4208043.1 AlpA family transcriptional regulator [Enterobacter hormaechei]MDR9902203.1 AlpA family transcriptional regulator [Enterobacter hormaechei subsp. xiangfangensis]
MGFISRENAAYKKFRLLRMSEVISLTGLPKSTIYLKIKNKEFPNQVPIGTRSVAWVEEEINDWIEKNIQNRKVKCQ